MIYIGATNAGIIFNFTLFILNGSNKYCDCFAMLNQILTNAKTILVKTEQLASIKSPRLHVTAGQATWENSARQVNSKQITSEKDNDDVVVGLLRYTVIYTVSQLNCYSFCFGNKSVNIENI